MRISVTWPRPLALPHTLALLLCLAYPNPVGAENVIYDNTSTYLDQFIAPGHNVEFGDEIGFGSGGWVLTEFEFEYYASGSGRKLGQFWLRALDGPEIPLGNSGFTTPTPGSVLFTSDVFQLQNNFQLVSIKDLHIPLPETVVWTVQFQLPTGNQAGLTMFDPPTVGYSFEHFWQRSADDWEMLILERNQQQVPVNFAARVTAVPEPGTALLAALSAAAFLGWQRFRNGSGSAAG